MKWTQADSTGWNRQAQNARRCLYICLGWMWRLAPSTTWGGRGFKVLFIESVAEEGVEMIKENSNKLMLRILRMRQLRERLGLSTSITYDRLNPMSPRYDCSFPRPIKLGASAVGWIEEDVCRWIESRIAESRNVYSVNS